jgi:hypothetical protein
LPSFLPSSIDDDPFLNRGLAMNNNAPVLPGLRIQASRVPNRHPRRRSINNIVDEQQQRAGLSLDRTWKTIQASEVPNHRHRRRINNNVPVLPGL